MWPYAHLLMFGGMVALHLGGMPWIMLDATKDFHISLNQIYMATWMGAAMVLLEGLMHPMPGWAWFATGAVMVLTAVAVRRQWFIGDREFLADMIPHHSMAILTSQRAAEKTQSGAVKKLATHIQKGQRAEIETMERMLAVLDSSSSSSSKVAKRT